MIPRVYTGWNAGRLLRYLFGPGEFDEHSNPRVVASWDGRPQRWQPEHVGPGEFDFDLGDLTAAVIAPLRSAGLPVIDPRRSDPRHRRFFRREPDGSWSVRTGPVRHLTLRNDSADRKLTDAEWAHVAAEMLHRAGWARRDDPGGPRWVAVRHDDDGIHVVAVMVRQDNGRRVWPRHDWHALRRCAGDMERRFGITLTAQADGTAARNPSRGETEKAARQGRIPARDELRAAVSQTASVTLDEQSFIQELRNQGYLAELVLLPSGQARGYKVACPGDTNAAGTPIWYSGTKLASDLTLPRLRRRWQQARQGRGADPGVAPAEAWIQRTVTVVGRARRTLRSDPGAVDGIAHAVGEVQWALDRGEGRMVSGMGSRWDRASRAPREPVPAASPIARDLRWMARGLGSSRVGTSAAFELAAALAALMLQIAALQARRDRPHQAQAARRAAHAASRPPRGTGPVRPTPRLAHPRPPARPGTQRAVWRPRTRQRPGRAAGPARDPDHSP